MTLFFDVIRLRFREILNRNLVIKIKGVFSLSDPSVNYWLFLSVGLGLFSAFVEYAFVISFQSFLAAFKILDIQLVGGSDYLKTLDRGYLIVLLAMVSLTRSFVEGLKTFISRVVQQKYCTINRKRIIHLSLHNLSDISSSKIISIFTEEIQRLSFAVLNISSFLINLFSSIVLVIICLRLAGIETLVALAIMFILSLPLTLLNRYFYNVGSDLRFHWQKTSEALTSAIRNNFFLKIYGLVGKSSEHASHHLDNYLKLYTRTFKILGVKSSISSFLGIVAVIVICLMRDYMGSTTSSSALLSFFYVFLRFTQSLTNALNLFSEFRINTENISDLKNTLTQLERSEEIKLSDNNRKPSVELNDLVIDCKHVSFTFEENVDLITDISFSLKEGQILLISGESGSGKSTLLSLLIGLIKPTSGEMQLNKMSVSDIQDQLKSMIGYVGPYPYLIDGSVQENLSYAHPRPENINASDIQEVINKSQATYVYSLSDGIQTSIDENGSQLSTGQKQRLMLARALLRKPRILILDEFTANLDEQIEQEIMEMIVKEKKNKIIIIVSHKTSFQKISDHHLNLKRSSRN